MTHNDIAITMDHCISQSLSEKLLELDYNWDRDPQVDIMQTVRDEALIFQWDVLINTLP